MHWLDTVGHDVRYSGRLIRKSPVLSIATILTLALGIGLDAGVFTVINGLLFRPRVAHDPATFVEVHPDYGGTAGLPQGLPFVSIQDYEAYRRASSLSDLAAWTPVHASIGASTRAEGGGNHVPLLVTCNFFAVYGDERPLVGRVFRPEECAVPGETAVAVIGEDLWRTQLGANPQVVGTSLVLNDRRYTIVGVMPSGYAGQLRAPIWVPYTMATPFFAGRDLFREPATPWLLGMSGRLRPGAARSIATSELQVLARRQDELVTGRRTSIHVTTGSMIEAPLIREMAVWIVPLVMGALSLVLLIACANVTMLLLSRSAARQHEMAVRLSLGASRSRLLRMLLTESVVLATIAALPSVYLTVNVPVLLKKINPSLPYYPFAVDAPVLMYLAGITLLAGMLAGIAPAIESLKGDVSASLHGQETFLGAKTRWRSRDVLVAAQVGMSLVLLVGAGLFVHAEWRLLVVNPGYETDHVLLVTPRISVPPHTPASAASFYQALADRVRGVPGVLDAAYSTGLAADELSGGGSTSVTAQSTGLVATTAGDAVSSRYFDVLGIPMVRGASFRDGDAAARIQPIVVSQSLARTLWPDRDPIGELVDLNGDRGHLLQVVGVSRDIRSPIATAARERTLYRVRASESRGDALLVRFDGDERRTAAAVRDAIAALDRDAVAEPRTLAALREELASRFFRLVKMVLGLGVVAVVLAVIGIYGVVAFAVTRRMKEMGIRVALGATRRDIVRLVLSSGLKPIAAGVGGGVVAALPASLALTRIFRNTPIHLDPRDPIAYAAVTLLLVATAIAAMLGPALRAAWADPVHALRQD